MISVCIITKNEKENMEKCLQSLEAYGLEIIVADTGSSDGTKETVLRYTKKLFDFPWCDDFAAAKNFAVSKASNEYVLVIDSDEILELPEPKQMEKLYQQIKKNPHRVGRIRRRNTFVQYEQKPEVEEWINRIFSKKWFHYEGRIHEQVAAKDNKSYETYKTDIVLRHSGYDLPAHEKEAKAQRNIGLLTRELEQLRAQEPEDKERIPYILYQLGKSFYMAKDYNSAYDYFSQGLTYDLNPGLEYVIDMVDAYGYAMINSNRAQEALGYENIYKEFGENADFQFLMGLIYMNNESFDKAVMEFQKAAGHKTCRTQGVNSFLAYYNIGVIYECLGKQEKAAEYYRKCKDYAPALERLSGIPK